MPTFHVKLVEGVKIQSLANARGHWARRHKLIQGQRLLGRQLMVPFLEEGLKPPLLVKLTRAAPRFLDEGDNLAMAFKAIRDGIADAFGVSDRDAGVLRFQYAQERWGAREYGFIIELAVLEGGDGIQ